MRLVGEPGGSGDLGEAGAGPDDLQPRGAHPQLDGWKLIAQQVYASLLDPPAIALPAAQLDEYTGTYQLTGAIDYAIRRDGDHLVGQRTGRPPQVLRAEARDVMFVPGQPRSRKVFLRDAAGRITGFADRREARDVVWTRRDPPAPPAP